PELRILLHRVPVLHDGLEVLLLRHVPIAALEVLLLGDFRTPATAERDDHQGQAEAPHARPGSRMSNHDCLSLTYEGRRFSLASSVFASLAPSKDGLRASACSSAVLAFSVCPVFA